MIVQGTKSVVKTNTTQQSKFTINATGHAFRILSDGLYQHKVAAIIREVSCNAYDSHVQAGKEDVPFVVTLPNFINPFFEVEDFGLGLDDEGVRSIFTSYFTSTKQSTNDAVGMFGLGSKTPFTMSDTFSITARKNGMERVYEAFIGEDGAPQVALVYEDNTEKENGVKISVPISTSRVSEFTWEASFILSFFKTKPIVKGSSEFKFAMEDIAGMIEKEGIVSRKVSLTGSNLYNKSIYAVMGGVCYPVTQYDLDLNDENKKYYDQIIYRYNNTVFLKYNIGDLEVTPSRESLSMTERTKKNLSEKANEYFANLKKITQEQIDACPNVYQAGLYIQKNFGSLNVLSNTFTYRGGKVDKPLRKSLKCNYLYSVPRRKAIMGSAVALPTLAEKSLHVIFVPPKAKQIGVMQYGREKARNSGYDSIILVFKNASESSVRRLFTVLGLSPTFEQYVAPAAVKRAKGASTGKRLEDSKVRAVSYIAGTHDFNLMRESVLDLNDGKYAYYTSDYSGILDSRAIGRYFDFIKDYKFIKKTTKNAKKIEKAGVPSVADVCNKALEDNKSLLLKHYKDHSVQCKMEITKMNFIIDNDSEFTKFGKTETSNYSYVVLAKELNSNDISGVIGEVEDFCKGMQSKYFFLGKVTDDAVFKKLVKLVLDNEKKSD
jgi:hypothetical protein